jgi:hypothetical protein
MFVNADQLPYGDAGHVLWLKAKASATTGPMRWEKVGVSPPAAHPLKSTTDSLYKKFTELRRTLTARESNSLGPWAVAPGAFLFPVPSSTQRIPHGRPIISHPVRRRPSRRSPPYGPQGESLPTI